MLKRIFFAACGALPLLLQGNTLSNGDFEKMNEWGMPQDWRISHKHIGRGNSLVEITPVQCSDSPAGPNCLKIVCPQKLPHDVFSSLVQRPKLEPGRKYRLGFWMKGEPISQLLIIRGLHWGQRWTVPGGSLKPDAWSYFYDEFVAKPEFFEKDGGYMILFNFEGASKGTLLDGISCVPVDGEILPGIRSGRKHVSLKQLPETESSGHFLADLMFSDRELPDGWKLSVELTGRDGKHQIAEIGNLHAVKTGERFKLNLAIPFQIPVGKFKVTLKTDGKVLALPADAVFVHAESPLIKEAIELARRLKKARMRYDRLLIRLPDRKSAYLNLYRFVLDDQFRQQEKDQAYKSSSSAEWKFYIDRSRIAIAEIEDALDGFEAFLKCETTGNFRLESWQFISGPVKYVKGFPVAKMRREDGTMKERPVFFGGFGHFRQAREDMPFLSKLGSNILQMEAGPYTVFPRAGRKQEFEPDNGFMEKTVIPTLKRAWENNYQVSFLLSPHHVPQWFKKRYPEAFLGNGFMPLDFNHLKTQELYMAYLEYLIPRLASSPYRGALHDIVISNEPSDCRYKVKDACKDAEHFGSYILRQYGSLENFNKEAGTSFADFKALAASAAKREPAALREFINFKKEFFTGWHKQMTEKIRKLWPEAPPINTKIQGTLFFAENQMEAAVDPELFAEISDLNGNDNGVSCWQHLGMCTDLQWSMKPVSIINSEYHFINDAEVQRISSDLIYRSTIQQYLHGVSALIHWVWDSAGFDRPEYLQGGIRHRADNIIAIQKAVMDANRLSEEIVAFNLVEPQVAILYSPESLILNRDQYCKMVYRVWTDLSTTGHKLRFLSEKQIQRGEFGDVKLIVAPGVRNISRKTLNGLRKFVSGSGIIAGRGECFTQDEYGRPLNAGLEFHKGNSREDLQRLVKRYFTLPAAVDVLTPEKSMNVVQRRIVTLPDERILANIVNYDVVPHRIRLTVPAGKKAVDLISGEAYPMEFILLPDHPLLLEFR